MPPRPARHGTVLKAAATFHAHFFGPSRRWTKGRQKTFARRGCGLLLWRPSGGPLLFFFSSIVSSAPRAAAFQAAWPPTLGKDGIVPPQSLPAPHGCRGDNPGAGWPRPAQHPFVTSDQPRPGTVQRRRPDPAARRWLAAAHPPRPHAARPATQSGAAGGVGGSAEER